MNQIRAASRLFEKLSKPVRLNPNRNKSKKISYPNITMNDLPNPEGDFYTQFNARQRAYNLHLALGIGSLIATIGFGLATDMYVFYGDIPSEVPKVECYK